MKHQTIFATLFLIMFLFCVNAFGHTDTSHTLTAHYNDWQTNCHVHEYEGGSGYWNIANGKVAGRWEFGDLTTELPRQPDTPPEALLDSLEGGAPTPESYANTVAPPTEGNDVSAGSAARRIRCNFDIQIVGVTKLKKPNRILLTTRNNSRFYADLRVYRLELWSVLNRLKTSTLFSGGSITWRRSNGEIHADSVIVLLPTKSLVDTYRLKVGEVSKARMQYNTKQVGGYKETDTFILLCDDIEIARYPEEVSMAPRLQRRLTTCWGAIKRL